MFCLASRCVPRGTRVVREGIYVGNAKTLRSCQDTNVPLSAECWRDCVLCNESQRHALMPRYQSKEMKVLNISFLRVAIESTTCHVYNRSVPHFLPNSGIACCVAELNAAIQCLVTKREEKKILNI